MKLKFRRAKKPSSNESEAPSVKDRENRDSENVIEQDSNSELKLRQKRHAEKEDKPARKKKSRSFFDRRNHAGQKKEVPEAKKKDAEVKSRTGIERFAYNLLSGRLPELPEYREEYPQAGIPIVYDAYLSNAFFLSFISSVAAFAVSLVVEIRLLPRAPIWVAALGSGVLAGIAFGVSVVIWLSYPLLRKRSFKSKLENQLAYSFGILGVLAASGMNLERLFEKIATSESNPVLADLANRFLRNIKIFGLDTESSLAEVSKHSPSRAFSKMLESIAVAHKTTGSVHDLVMFESARLLQEKRDHLRKTIGTLAVMAELYITLVVVGPIIFVVMMAIFGLLPSGGLPDPVEVINLIIFIGIPVLSVMFVLLLDSMVGKA